MAIKRFAIAGDAGDPIGTRIHRISGTLKTGVHRKPTHTGRYLHFESDHRLSAKRSVVKSLLDRLEYVTFGKEEIAKEKELIREELAANGYPRKFITEIAKKQRKLSHSTSNSNTHKPKGTATIPYVKGLSEPITRILGQLDIRTVMRPKKQIGRSCAAPKTGSSHRKTQESFTQSGVWDAQRYT